MAAESKNSIFLSAASTEFQTVRGEIASDLRTVGLSIVNQEIFRQVPDAETTLDLLHKHVCESEIVVCIAGNKTGAIPGPKSHAKYQQLIPDEFETLSYTQWEFIFARHYKKDVHVFLSDETNELKNLSSDQLRADENLNRQNNFIRYIKRTAELNRTYFSTPDKLRIAVLTVLGFNPRQAAKPQNLPNATLGTLFKGRDKFLKQISSELRKGVTAITAANKVAGIKSPKPTAVSGSGGIGKTRAAIEYAWQNQNDYSALLFVNAETPEQLITNLASLYGVLKIEGLQDATDEARLNAVLDWLNRHPGWLAILDNVDSKESQQAVTEKLAQLTAGHVLITSRIARWGNSVQKLALDVLTVEAAGEYLRESATDRQVTADDDQQSENVARKVGQLALGLEHAKGYINQFGISFADYLKEWEEDEAQILEEFPAGEIEYPRELLITWKLSVDRLDDDSRRLLEVLAWFASAPIPESVLENLPDNFLTGNAKNAIANLVDFCLVNRVQDLATDGSAIRSLKLHRLVQATTRYHLLHDEKSNASSDAGQLPSLEIALQTINDSFIDDPDDVRSWSFLEPLAVHAQSIADFAIKHEKVSTEHPTPRLLNDLGLLYAEKVRFPIAELNYRRALSIDEQAFGKEHPNVAIRLNNIAHLYQDTNRFLEAERLARRALVIDETEFGSRHPNVGRDLHNIAGILLSTNRLSEAEPLMRRALGINESFYGREHPQVIAPLNNLGLLLQTTDRLTEAESLKRRVLRISVKNFGWQHPEVAMALNNLAWLLMATNRRIEAEPLMTMALEINEQAFGEEHPKVATCLNNLALLLLDTNRVSNAEALMRQALKISEQVYGKNHPDVAVGLNNLSVLLKSNNRIEEAEHLMKRALEIDEQAFGTEHPNVAIRVNNLAQLFFSTARHDEAEPLMRRSLRIDVKSLGDDHTRVATDLNNLAQLLMATNRLSEAEPLMRRALEVFRSSLGNDHPNTLTVAKNYEILLSDSGKNEGEIKGIMQSIFQGVFQGRSSSKSDGDDGLQQS